VKSWDCWKKDWGRLIGESTRRDGHVRFVPKADIWQRSKVSLYSMTSSARGERRRHVEASRDDAHQRSARNSGTECRGLQRDSTNISDRTIEAGISAKAQ